MIARRITALGCDTVRHEAILRPRGGTLRPSAAAGRRRRRPGIGHGWQAEL